MKHVLCLSVLMIGLSGFNQSADAQPGHAYRSGAVPPNSTYASDMRHLTVVRVQRALERRGYYVGLSTGEYAAETRAAVQRYQRDHGLRRSGKIDGALLASLQVH